MEWNENNKIPHRDNSSKIQSKIVEKNQTKIDTPSTHTYDHSLFYLEVDADNFIKRLMDQSLPI
jgi:hypothetical protein